MAITTLLLLSTIGLGLVSATPLMSCTCGKKKHQMSSRMIGWADSDVNEYPWMVALKIKPFKYDKIWCGATVINSKWVLTAAHCMENYESEDREPKEFKLVLGEHNLLSANEADTEEFDVVKIVKHPRRKDVDLALMMVEGTIDISTYTPICLPKPGFDVRGEMITVAGWGSTCWEEDPLQGPCDIYDISSKTLQEADMPVPANAVCRQNKADHFCFGGNGKTACHGDSGSGVIFNDHGRWTLVGAVSGASPGSQDCGIGPRDFGSSAEVSQHMTWIEETAVGGTTCAN